MSIDGPDIPGSVTEVLPSNLYRVQLDGEDAKSVICYLAGKMKLNHIRVLIGDRVTVVLDKYGGKATNRITRRL